MEEKKLYRSRANRTFLGICGGLAEYFGKDATLFRLIFLLLLVCTGFVPFGLAYLLAYFIMPLEPENK
ncbi:MAG: PspC domain-containing protein [Elusimicrobiales bacterium]|nr:PspC domain-containing protein [Elusimicrobiales bacterium]